VVLGINNFGYEYQGFYSTIIEHLEKSINGTNQKRSSSTGSS
jgi:hypothetical protein